MCDDSRGAIICSHVAKENLPILRAVRDEPMDPTFSGWQFTCGLNEHENTDTGLIWLVEEVLNLDQSLRPFIEMPVGTALTRGDAESSWTVERNE